MTRRRATQGRLRAPMTTTLPPAVVGYRRSPTVTRSAVGAVARPSGTTGPRPGSAPARPRRLFLSQPRPAGMSRGITRRDVLSGLGVGVVGSLAGCRETPVPVDDGRRWATGGCSATTRPTPASRRIRRGRPGRASAGGSRSSGAPTRRPRSSGTRSTSALSTGTRAGSGDRRATVAVPGLVPAVRDPGRRGRDGLRGRRRGVPPRAGRGGRVGRRERRGRGEPGGNGPTRRRVPLAGQGPRGVHRVADGRRWDRLRDRPPRGRLRVRRR